MRPLYIILIFFFCTASAQKSLPLDTLKLKEAKDMLADDYGNLYIYKNKDFSFTKYDSLGKQLGKMMLTVPYKVQSVQNPLSLALFSENAQEMKFVDQNMNEIQKVDFKQKFGFIKMAYAEDLQQLWLLDDSTKRLIQYNFRNDTTINAYPFDVSFDDLMDLLVYETKVYILTRKHLRIYSLKFEKLFEAPLENGKRFRRENEAVLIVADNAILKYDPEKGMVKVFEDKDAQIVDKNILSYFEIKANKLYIYSLEKIKETKLQTEPENKQETAPPVTEPSEKTAEEEGKKTEEEKKESIEKAPDHTLQKLIEDTSEVQAAGV
ncbi:hypothetical protein B0A69_19005 [Chryseobacterium shigense]|uniref:Uncharacterized protein n=1 Tax=Chryseobacterium shigense TaxID=297244 RepID=A0A1N7HYN3_9FLAO|nr:hypothetical protein [Chryseobacterium shigense]PQA90827.1 hypothetical protein B0A69_19005 [Chryseobacterium shigense]SIS29969.1 hypothetical protein SAMN05421639_101666 [Chryseobacterium shigense]